MLDKYKRRINYLRISVTDRCNFRCTYCMPEEGIELMSHHNILSFDEIMEVVHEGVARGITKIRLTGGEPLVRKGIITLVKMIADTPGIKDFGLTTNGVYLTKYAKQLAKAGLHRVNISLDTLDPAKFTKLTRVGTLHDVLAGIEAAKEANLQPIKINCVIQKSSNEPDAVSVKEYCDKNDLKIRYIREMDLEKGTFWQVQGGEGGACSICSRFRLTANGNIKPCLFSELEYNVRELGVKNAFDMALENKPKTGTINKVNHFNNIGG